MISTQWAQIWDIGTFSNQHLGHRLLGHSLLFDFLSISTSLDCRTYPHFLVVHWFYFHSFGGNLAIFHVTQTLTQWTIITCTWSGSVANSPTCLLNEHFQYRRFYSYSGSSRGNHPIPLFRWLGALCEPLPPDEGTPFPCFPYHSLVTSL